VHNTLLKIKSIFITLWLRNYLFLYFMSPGTVVYRLESLQLLCVTVTPAMFRSIHNCVKNKYNWYYKSYTTFCVLDPFINFRSDDNVAKNDLSQVRVILICDLFLIVLIYLNTKFNKLFVWFSRIFLNVLLLIFKANKYLCISYSSSQHPPFHYPWRTVEFTRSSYQRYTCGWNPGILWSIFKYGESCVGRLWT